jgi:hypothetical protein
LKHRVFDAVLFALWDKCQKILPGRRVRLFAEKGKPEALTDAKSYIQKSIIIAFGEGLKSE